MKPVLLFDLDDTLLNNDIDRFLKVYLAALSRHMQQFKPEHFIHCLLSATQHMTDKVRPNQTLEEAFDEAFYPGLGVEKETIRGQLEQFYAEVFPSLQPVTSPRPEAVALIEKLLGQDYSIVIATNPLFPRNAILHRLAWAGLPADQYPFKLITSFEKFHFAKPNPAYYAEILAQLGGPITPALMIGNSLSDDIQASSRLGLPGFYLSETPADFPADVHPLSAQGNWSQLETWISRLSAGDLEMPYQQPSAKMIALKATPAALDGLTRNLPDSAWNQPPTPGEWSITEILAHLQDVDHEINLPRLQKILSEDAPFLAGIDSDPWAIERGYAKRNGKETLSQFFATRVEYLSMLENIPAESWKRSARHAIFGPTDLAELVSFIITHDRAHLNQVKETIQTITG